MTILQILALVLLGPIATVQIIHLYRAVRGGEFLLLQGVLLFTCIAGILAAFLGVS